MTRGEPRAAIQPSAAPNRGELFAAAGGLVALAAGGLVLGAAAAPGRATGRGDAATMRLLMAGERIAIAFYQRAGGAGVLPAAAAVQAHSALANERDHDAALREAAGTGAVGGRAAVREGPGLLDDAATAMRSAMALESALLGAYLSAAATLRSPDLRGLAAAIGANEAQHLGALRTIAAGEPVAGPALPVATGPGRARAELATFALGGRLP